MHRPEEKQHRNTLTQYVSLLTGPRRSLILPAKRVAMDSSMVFAHTVNLHEEYMYAIESSIVCLLASSGVALHVICKGTVVPP
jgi:hypothetical protein